MPPVPARVAAPAVLAGGVLQRLAMGHLDFIPECRIQVRIGNPVAKVAVAPVFRRVPKPGHVPRRYPVAFPAFPAEETSVDVGVALVALEAAVEKRMIDARNVAFGSPVLHMAFKAVRFRFMKPDLRLEHRNVTEFMTLQAHSFRHAPPGPVAETAVVQPLVEAAQCAGGCRPLVQKEPYAQGHRHEYGCTVDYLHDGTHLRP